MLAKDLSGLPKAAALKADPVTPDPEPLILGPWLDFERAAHEFEGERPHAVAGTWHRHSMAGRCARAMGYYIAGIQKSDPADLPSILTMRNGTRQHDLIQEVLVQDLSMEVEVPVEVPEANSSGSADGKLAGERVFCWEHKNVGGYAYKLAIGCPPVAQVPQGPKRNHILQGALNAKGMGADALVITYLTWEPLSRQIARAKGFSELMRICAQWTFPKEIWEPLADSEVRRMIRISEAVKGGELPARVIPDPELPPGHRIMNPMTGAYAVYDADELVVGGGTHWECDYCDWQTLCASTGSTRIPITDVNQVLGQ